MQKEIIGTYSPLSTGNGQIKNSSEKNQKDPINGSMLIGEILHKYPQTASVLIDHGMHCLGCPSSQAETLSDACLVHGLESEKVVTAVNKALNCYCEN